jgi:hypothetical protein
MHAWVQAEIGDEPFRAIERIDRADRRDQADRNDHICKGRDLI